MSKRILTSWWFRYVLIPALTSLPAGAVAYWFGVHQDQTTTYFLQGHQPVALSIAGIWAFGFTVLKSYLDEITKDAIRTLQLAQHDLANLLESVRLVVGAKSKRFHDALMGLKHPPDASKTFFEITQPDMQIKQLIGAARSYFQVKVDPNSEVRVRLSLMKPAGDTLVIVNWVPEADVPNARQERFRGDTIAGEAYFKRKLIISPDVSTDDRYHHFSGTRDEGSMFAYPVVDSLMDHVIYVINLTTSKVNEFRESDRQKIQSAMEIFAERIVLENRLAEIKEKFKLGEVAT